MNEEQIRKLIELLQEMNAQTIKGDEEGDAETVWYYYRDAVEDAMNLDRGSLNVRPDPEEDE